MTIKAHMQRTSDRLERWAYTVQRNDDIRRMIRAGATIEQVRKRYPCSQTDYDKLRGWA